MSDIVEVVGSDGIKRRASLVSIAGGSGGYQAVENLAVVVPASGDTTLLDADVATLSRIAVEIANTTQALDGFKIQAKFTPNGDWITLYSLSADFATPQGLLIGVSGDLTVLAAGSVGFFILDVSSFSRVRVLASAAANNAVVSTYMGGR